MIPRLQKPLLSSSFFLFGARGTGKTTLLKKLFAPERTLWIDLLDPEQEHRYALRPGELKGQIEAGRDRFDWVVIDEIQRLPKLLDVVHATIESLGTRFALTGSSARRLKQNAVNLLAGRAFVYHLFPLTSIELGPDFDLIRALRYGTLPSLCHFQTDAERKAYLRAYALTYLKEEVWAEQLIRKLDPFRRFLPIAAQCNGEIVNYTNIARDSGADHKTVMSYFEILEDTLLGFLLEPYHTSVRKRQRQSPKFYFFDPGLVRALSGLLNVELVTSTYGFGRAFEHFVILEMVRLNEYYQKDYRFSYLLTKDGAEIDLIVERPGAATVLIELTSKDQVDERDIRTLSRFLPDFPGAEAFCLSRDQVPKRLGNILAIPWQDGLKQIIGA
ncbi:ATP-binding protein [bacterium]|nr:ATP-binding protein [bacterium]